MIHAIIGTRAQLIKTAPVLLELERRGARIDLILTGQHSETMQQLLDDFGVRTRPAWLWEGTEVTGVLQMGQWWVRSAVRLLRERDVWLPMRDPDHDVILVHGDTVSTLLGACVGHKLKLPVAHLESGLRSFNLFHPFPEELTRLAVFRLADYAFCPGQWAVANLQGRVGNIVDTRHNTLLDAVRAVLCNAPIRGCAQHRYAVASVHRFENLRSRSRLSWIVDRVCWVAQRFPVNFVLHPVTAKRLEQTGLRARLDAEPGVHMLNRMVYSDFLRMIAGADVVLTDGGSNQEELYYLGKPTVLLRDATERQEGIGVNVLLSHYDRANIEAFITRPPVVKAPLIEARVSPSAIVADALQWAFG